MSGIMQSIIARIGADTGPLRLGMTEAVKVAQWGADQMQKSLKASAKAQADAAKESARVQEQAFKSLTEAIVRNNQLEAAAIANRVKVAQAAAATERKLASEASGRVIKGNQANRQRLGTGDYSGEVTIGGRGRGSGGAGGHGGHGNMQNATLVGEGLDAVTGQQGWVMRMQMLSRMGPLGVAIAGVGMVAAKTIEQLNEMKHANEELGKTLKTSAVGAEGMRSRREDLSKGVDEVMKSRQGFSTRTGLGRLTSGIYKAATGKDPEAEGLRLQRQADAEMQQMDSRAAAIVSEQMAARRAGVTSERGGKLADLHFQTSEKLDTLQDQASGGKMGVEEYAQRRKEIQQGAEIEAAAIEKKAAADNRQLDLEAKLLEIKQSGRDVDVESAAAKSGSSNADYLAAVTEEEKKAALIKANAAEEEYRDAKRARTEREDTLAVEMQIAGLTGASDVKHLAALQIEEAHLKRKLERAKSDTERGDIGLQLAGNRNAQRDAGINAGMVSFDAASSGIDVNTGRGSAEARRALGSKILLEQSRYSFMQGSGADAGALAKQLATIVQMRKQFQEMAEAQKRSVDQATTETAVMEQQLQHHNAIAQAIQTRAAFQQRIDDALKDGNKGLADQLRKQQSLTERKQARDIAQGNRESLQMSLGEVAQLGRGRDASRARRALQYEARARRRAASGNLVGAKDAMDRAQKLKDGIRGLRDSEKSGSKDNLKGALDESVVLAAIRDGVTKIGVPQ